MALDENTDRGGIRDRDDKTRALKLLLKVKSNREMMSALLQKAPRDIKYVTSAEKLANSFKSWAPGPHSHAPTGDAGRTFLGAIRHYLQSLGCEHTAIEEVVEHGAIDDFIDLIPLRLTTPSIDRLRRYPTQDERMLDVVADPDAWPPSVEQGFRDGTVDQRHCYMSPSAPEAWENLIRSGTYDQYEDCLEALEAFLATSEWKNFCRITKPDGAVACGAGSSTKDLAIIRSLQSHVPKDREVLTYAVVDCSHSMMEATVDRIRKALPFINHARPTNVRPVKSDFLNLRRTPSLRRQGAPVAWFINGGTIGNVNEAMFLNSIRRRAEPGDLLAISMETIPESAESGAGRDEYISRLIKKYDTPVVREVVRPAMSAIWPQLRHPESIDSALESILVKPVDGTRYGYSQVPNSLTIEISTTGGCKDVVLVTSSRYHERDFVSFAALEGFRHVVSTEGTQNPSHKMLAFEYSPQGL